MRNSSDEARTDGGHVGRSTDDSTHPFECPVCCHSIRAVEEFTDGGKQIWECPDEQCRIYRLRPGEVTHQQGTEVDR